MLQQNAWDELQHVRFFQFTPALHQKTHSGENNPKTTDMKDKKSPSELLQRNEQNNTEWCLSEQSSGVFRWSCDVTSTGTHLHRLRWDWLWHVHCSCDERLRHVCHLVVNMLTNVVRQHNLNVNFSDITITIHQHIILKEKCMFL